jgi:hypothetical protein
MADLKTSRGPYPAYSPAGTTTSGTRTRGEYTRYIDERPAFRRLVCPGCGTPLENEIAL